MKKITILLVLISMVSFTGLNANVILDETFNYTEADLGNVTGWSITGTAPNGDQLASTKKTISAPALVYAPSDEYVLSGVGKKVAVTYDGKGSSHADDASNYRNSKSFTEINSGSVYLSFLFWSGNQNQTQSDAISFNRGTTSGPRLWAGKANPETAGLMRFGVTTGSTTGSAIKWGANIDVNTTYLIVLKHDFSTSTTALYINPTINGAEPVAYTSDNTTFTGALNNIAFRLNQGNDANFEISGVRVSTTWAEAVAKKTATGLQTMNNESAFRVLGNTISTSQAGTLEIYDMKGSRMLQTAITDTYNCDLSKGLYIVRLTTNTGKTYSEKISIN